ncbi:multiple epidermal growth factor-like domains protein 10 [Saccostrea cucullata]|uniref:multiple epidermal growth factor-like domains protein 10 n=1 Tax=Saccostrea cuccullata TaxID=36930 RepID=UPI002ED0EB75
MDILSFVTFLNIIHVSTANDPNKCGSGSCCSGYFLNDNICTECPPGTYGFNCGEECNEGYYGRECRKRCPLECVRNCNSATEYCPVFEAYLQQHNSLPRGMGCGH